MDPLTIFRAAWIRPVAPDLPLPLILVWFPLWCACQFIVLLFALLLVTS